jgi:glycosyltransferase involved in cell wall biosynthesis
VKEYFFRLITLRIKIKDCVIPNTFFFSLVRKTIHQEFKQIYNSIAFTFQTQSLIDGSIPGIRNYVFTDNTYLENLNNEFYDKNKTPTSRWLAFEKTLYTNAAKIFVMSSNVRNSLINQYHIDQNKIKVVYTGGNINSVSPDSDLKDYSLKNILFIGGNWSRKGGQILLQAFRKVREIHKDATLTIVSWRAPQISEPGVSVYGKVSLDEIGNLFNTASIFCMPSYIEPFGIVFIEAMMNKLPIIATKINAIPDFVIDNENGFLVQPGNVEQLEIALMKLLDAPALCKKFGENGFKLYREKYNWDNVFQKIRNIIKDDTMDSAIYNGESINQSKLFIQQNLIEQKDC